MNKTALGHILWVDDEIELLRPHIIFLESKGYKVTTVSNGRDALDCCKNISFDLIFLDENMPGLSGLQTLSMIKEINPTVPVVMITKSEEEDIMNQAIGSKIADYLIKPVNPNQILLSIKKNLHRKEIVTETTQTSYQQNFGKIGMQINDSLTFNDWIEVYRRLVYWELELEESESSMNELLSMQKTEANAAFIKFIKRNYLDWMDNKENRPLMSPDLIKHAVFPLLDKKEKVFFIVVDNFRYDQWKAIEKEIATWFTVEEELYYSILPTTTQYARNAIFSGLMPNKIAEMFPDLWVDEEEEEGKNINESPLVGTHIDRYRRKDSFTYTKINDIASGERLLGQLDRLYQHDLNVIVFNFIDMLSHARTESKMIRELTTNEAAYRSLALSWFRHSPLKELLKILAEKKYKVVITTDHGSIKVDNPIKVVGTKDLNTSLRHKLGRNMTYNAKQVFEINKPQQAELPPLSMGTNYIFATGRDFFAYPNNYNYYVSYYTNTFQHGGVSMEEMIIPLATLTPR
ncbi:PglZ domain-containing protein [Bacteroides sp. 214]|uniref:T9SS response regulator signal transducer PorX n=1 Tax=Bacteroides sp. 214 TaxID=2302935 RepID=UPI0013D06B11|nr:bifunctional response regulator/alkaline phosphatase family protein [Bacteroides sp. 214]NDW13656.1 PglZ domain-containing protein [Bacteroides sp. 214]